MNLRKTFLTFALAGLAAGCASQPARHAGGYSGIQSGTGAALTASDTDFAHSACRAAAAQVELGQLAALNTRNREIRKFARHLSEDHREAAKELDRLFEGKGLEARPELASDLDSSLDRVATLKGSEFDRAFKEEAIQSHKRALATFEQEARQGADPDLRAFAQKRLPELRQHLAIAEGLPISSDKEGPKPDSNLNGVLGNPAIRSANIPAGNLMR